MKTRITELLGIEYPIIQGAMQYLSRADLAAAVSNAGGLGIIPSMSFPDVEDLRKEIQKVKSLTDKPFGVNISLVPDTLVPELITKIVQVIIDEKVPVVETAGQKPTSFLKALQDEGIKVIHKCATVRHALSVQDSGVDAVTIVGFEGGGHPGMENVAGQILWSKATEQLTIPVLAAGGVVDGKSMYAAMSTGVEGVVIGTRFLACNEVYASEELKHCLIDIQENETVLTLRSLKNAFRVWHNDLASKVLEMEENKASLEELLPVISGRKSFDNMLSGDIQNAQISMGQGVGRITDVKPAGEIVASMVKEFKETHERMASIL